MKLVLTNLLLLSMFLFSNAQSQYGTPLPAKLVADVSSEDDISTTQVVVAQDVNLNGRTFIKSGTPIYTEVETTPRKGVGRSGKIKLKAVSTKDVNGNRVNLAGSHKVSKEDIKGKVIGVSAGVGWLVWPMLAYLAKKGKSAEMASNTSIHSFIIAQ